MLLRHRGKDKGTRAKEDEKKTGCMLIWFRLLQAFSSEIYYGRRLTTLAPNCLLQNTLGHVIVCLSTKSTVSKLFVFICISSGCPSFIILASYCCQLCNFLLDCICLCQWQWLLITYKSLQTTSLQSVSVLTIHFS